MSAGSDSLVILDASFDWSGGVDSSKVSTLSSDLNPNGLNRNQLAWLVNATVRDGGITQRTGWQPLTRIIASGRWQGGFMYEPDNGNPYLVCSISGIIYAILLEPPYTKLDLTGGNPALRNPDWAEMAFFCQGENFLIIQAGDYYTPGPVIVGKTDVAGRTLPLFWDGTTLRRSIGITTPAPASVSPGINEIPAATCMDYYGNRLWYAQGRSYSAGDMAGGPSGTVAAHRRDSILSVTENPLCFAGDGFTVPTNAGNIRALKHSANLNASLGQGQFYIGTRKTIYSLTVPETRTDWINTTVDNGPIQTVVQLVNGFVGDRSVVPINGDLYYQSFDPAIRSLIRAVQYFEQPGNTAISQNERLVMQINDRALMRFSSGIAFDQRILNLVLPQIAADGINVIHRAIVPLDFDVVTNFETRKPAVWEGAYDGLNALQLFVGDFGGRERGFVVMISDVDGSLNVWELTTDSRTQNGDNRITWSPTFPAFTYAAAGYEFKLKQLNGGELWIDKVSGTVAMDIYYRTDADPCWRHWFHTEFCALRCEDTPAWDSAYPCQPYREGYVFPITLPEPPSSCNSMGVRPSTIGYQHQVKVMIKGWCRIRGLVLYAQPKIKAQFQGLTCAASPTQRMAVLPNPFDFATRDTIFPAPPPPAPPPPPPTPPPPPAPVLPNKAINPTPLNGAINQDPSGTILSWQNGGGATSYSIYFNGAFQANQVGTTFSPGVLTNFTTYTWRIDSINADGTTTGDTWSFTTAGNSTVVDWVNRVLNNGGGMPSDATVLALSNFMDALDLASLTSKIIAMNCFAPDNLIAGLTPLIVGPSNDPWTNVGSLFVSGDLTVNGLKGDGGTKYLNIGIVPSDLPNFNHGFTLYLSLNDGANTTDFGAGNPTDQFVLSNFGNLLYYDDSYDGGSGRASSSVPGFTGYLSGSCLADNNRKLYNANSGTPHNILAGSVNVIPDNRASVTESFFLGALNFSGGPQQHSARRWSFVAFHEGFSASDSSAFFNAIQAMRTALGGGFA